MILYELSSGGHPHAGDDFATVLAKVVEEQPGRLGERNPQISPFFEEVVHTLLRKERGRRFPSAGKLLEVLEGGESSTWWGSRARALRAETKRPLRRIRIPRETAVFGRESELSRLRDIYDRAKRGEGGVVFLEGEAGIGKTRLVDELVGRLQQAGEDLNFLFGSYPPGGAATASGAWSTAYREHFGAEGLEETLRDYLSVTRTLIPAFGALLRGEPAPSGSDALTRAAIQTMFVHATRALAAERPTVVLIEDLHFAPEEGRALFAALALAVEGHRVLLVGTARPGVPGEWRASMERLEQASRLELTRLGPKDLDRLLKEAFRSRRLAEELGYRILTKSDGNPFFVFEIIRELRERGHIRRQSNGSWVSTGAIEEILIPTAVADFVRVRIAELAEDDQNLLEIASCVGFEFDPLLVGMVAGLDRIPLLQRLGRIEHRHRLVRSAGAVFVFDHHQVQESLYGGISELLRNEYHAAIAEALEQREKACEREPEVLGGVVVVALCEHYLSGARAERAVRYLNAALLHMTKGHQNDRAIGLAQRALAVPGLLEDGARFDLLLKVAGWLDLLGRKEDQRTALEEALRLADAGGDPVTQARARISMGWFLRRLSKNDEAREVLAAAVDLAREAGNRKQEALATGNLALVLSNLGKGDEARERFERQAALAREIGDRNQEATACGNIGLVAYRECRFDEALRHHERSLRVSQEIGYRKQEAIATGNLGLVLQNLGRHEEALARYEQHLELSREIGFREGEAIATGNLGNLYRELGRYEDSQRHHRRHLELSREIGYRAGEAIATANMSLDLAMLGRCAESQAGFTKALILFRRIGDRRGEALVNHHLSVLHTRMGDLAVAAERSLECRAVAGDVGFKVALALDHLARGMMSEVQGRPGEAEEGYREGLEALRALPSPMHVAEVLAMLGALLVREDRAEEARPLLDEAVKMGGDLGAASTVAYASAVGARLPGADVEDAVARFEKHEFAVDHAQRVEARFALWQATGDRGHLEKSHRLLLRLCDLALPELQGTMIEAVPLYREVSAAWRSCGEA